MPLDAVSRSTSLAHAAPVPAAAPPPPPPPPPPPAEPPTARVSLSAATARFLAAKKPPTPHEQTRHAGRELQARGASVDGKLLDHALGWVGTIRHGDTPNQALAHYDPKTRTITLHKDTTLPAPGKTPTASELRASVVMMHELAHAYLDRALTTGQPEQVVGGFKVERDRLMRQIAAAPLPAQSNGVSWSPEQLDALAREYIDEGIAHYVEHRIEAEMNRQSDLGKAQQIKDPARATAARAQAEQRYQKALAAPTLPLDFSIKRRYEISDIMRDLGDQILRTP